MIHSKVKIVFMLNNTICFYRGCGMKKEESSKDKQIKRKFQQNIEFISNQKS